MKKLIAIILVAFLAVSSSYAVDYTQAALSVPGEGSQGANDLSYADADGRYDIEVVCELEICNNSGDIDLERINPDGSRMLGTAYDQDYEVKGATSWYFEAWLGWDKFARMSDGTQTPHVYFVGENWTLQNKDGSAQSPTSDVMMTAAFDNFTGTGADAIANWRHVTGLDLNCDQCTQSCFGGANLVFHPVQVVADELAVEGDYHWNTFVAVDYLTWTQPLDPAGNVPPSANYPNNSI